ncbi:MAG: N-acetylneuraminate synthase family protein [Elusimicrobiales bacterium]|nr:N-acetylneuraminate synthase family protein [Elusimicrobiales bacterium]
MKLRKTKFTNKFMRNDRVFIIAEIGGNFTTFKEATRLIDSAVECCVDAVKIQTYSAETLSSRKAMFDMENTGVTSQFELFKKYEISADIHARIAKYARSKKMEWFSTPSHQKDVQMLNRLGVKAYKIGSDDAVNIPFLKYLAQQGKPIYMATGMCTMKEVCESVAAIQETGNTPLVLMHAVTSYPTHPEDVNLLAMKAMMKVFPEIPVGYSDHTTGITACVAAAALGARVIEKHFTYDKKADGPDHMLSANPSEMSQLVRQVREVELMLGSGVKCPAKGEKNTRLNNRKSLVVEADINKGERLASHNISVKRPGRGIAPKYYEEVMGKTATRQLKKDSLLRWADLD